MPRNKHPEETVQKILNASLALFTEKGYEKTTVLDIVNRMDGLTRGAFYHHFKSKEEVLDALGYKLFRENNPFEKARQQSNMNGLEKLRYAIQANMMDEATKVVNEASIALFDDPKFLFQFFSDNKVIVYPEMEKFVQEGMEDGSIRPGNAKLVTEFVMLLANIWFLPQLFDASEEESLQKLAMVKDILDQLGLPLFDEATINVIMCASENSIEK